MKKIIATLAIMISVSSLSFATKNPSLAKEIKEKVTININNYEIDNFNKTFLTVKFKILNGKIKINKINGSTSHKFNKQIINKLTHLNIESIYENEKEYTYKFILKK